MLAIVSYWMGDHEYDICFRLFSKKTVKQYLVCLGSMRESYTIALMALQKCKKSKDVLTILIL